MRRAKVQNNALAPAPVDGNAAPDSAGLGVGSSSRERRRRQPRRRVQVGSFPAELHGLTPEAIAAGAAEPVAREQFHYGRCAAEAAPFEVGLQLDDGGVDREPPLDLSPQRVRHRRRCPGRAVWYAQSSRLTGPSDDFGPCSVGPVRRAESRLPPTSSQTSLPTDRRR